MRGAAKNEVHKLKQGIGTYLKKYYYSLVISIMPSGIAKTKVIIVEIKFVGK